MSSESHSTLYFHKTTLLSQKIKEILVVQHLTPFNDAAHLFINQSDSSTLCTALIHCKLTEKKVFHLSRENSHIIYSHNISKHVSLSFCCTTKNNIKKSQCCCCFSPCNEKQSIPLRFNFLKWTINLWYYYQSISLSPSMWKMTALK